MLGITGINLVGGFNPFAKNHITSQNENLPQIGVSIKIPQIETEH